MQYNRRQTRWLQVFYVFTLQVDRGQTFLPCVCVFLKAGSDDIFPMSFIHRDLSTCCYRVQFNGTLNYVPVAFCHVIVYCFKSNFDSVMELYSTLVQLLDHAKRIVSKIKCHICNAFGIQCRVLQMY